jgi:hypothetical protein
VTVPVCGTVVPIPKRPLGHDSEVPGGSGNPGSTTALQVLDSDMAQYIHDNTLDQRSPRAVHALGPEW